MLIHGKSFINMRTISTTNCISDIGFALGAIPLDLLLDRSCPLIRISILWSLSLTAGRPLRSTPCNLPRVKSRKGEIHQSIQDSCDLKKLLCLILCWNVSFSFLEVNVSCAVQHMLHMICSNYECCYIMCETVKSGTVIGTCRRNVLPPLGFALLLEFFVCYFHYLLTTFIHYL